MQVQSRVVSSISYNPSFDDTWAIDYVSMGSLPYRGACLVSVATVHPYRTRIGSDQYCIVLYTTYCVANAAIGSV
jgi:hypothetical protein